MNQPKLQNALPKWTEEQRQNFIKKIWDALDKYQAELNQGNLSPARGKFISEEHKKLEAKMALIEEDRALEIQIKRQENREALRKLDEENARNLAVRKVITTISNGIKLSIAVGIPVIGSAVGWAYQYYNYNRIDLASQKAGESIDQVSAKTAEIQNQISACIETNKYIDPKLASYSGINGAAYFEGPNFSADIYRYQAAINKDRHRNFQIFPCETSAGTIYLSLEFQKDKLTCKTSGKEIFYAIPAATINSDKIACGPITNPEETAMCEPTLFITGTTNSLENASTSHLAIKESKTDSTHNFLEVEFNQSLNSKAKQEANKWQGFMKESLEKAAVSSDNNLAKAEISGRNIESFFRDYVKDFQIIKGPKATDNDVKKLEAIKPLLVKSLVKFYQYLEANTPAEKRINIIKNFYRHFKCNPIITTIDNTLEETLVGKHIPNSRDVIINGKELIYPNRVVKTWFHEIMHDLTTDNLKGTILDKIDYHNGNPKVMIEGVAEIATLMIDINSATYVDQEYLDFTTLASAYLGKEGFIECFSEEEGLSNNINQKHPERIEKFMNRWKIRPRYKKDIEEVFGHGNPLYGHGSIRILDIYFSFNNTTKRLILLKEVLQLNGIKWDYFKKIVTGDFNLENIKTTY